MPKPYSIDLRARVIEAVAGGASRREAAEDYAVAPSTVVLWAQRFEATGSITGNPFRRQRVAAGGARGPASGAGCQAAGFDAERDRGGERGARDRGQPGNPVAVLQSSPDQPQEEASAGGGAKARGVGTPAAALDPRAGLFGTWPGRSLSMRPAPPPPWCGFMAAAHTRGERLVGYAPHRQRGKP